MFPRFPVFIPLSLELKDTYNKMVGEFPPYSDISFVTLQIWWNLDEKLLISSLNDNLVISYSLPFDKSESGLCIVGKNKIDESIHTIFQYLKDSGKEVKLVHVPKFVTRAIKHPDAFLITEETNYNEYLLDSKSLSGLEGHQYQLLRKKIKRFVRSTGEKKIEIRSLDLALERIQDEVFQSIIDWEKKNTHQNDPDHTEHLALRKTLKNASALDIKNLGVYIENELHGIMLYHQPLSKKYFILHHAKVNYDSPYISDFLHHEVAKHAAKNNVSRLNIEMDLGIENLKKHKLTLRPTSYFKKYSIYPSQLLTKH